MPDFKVSPPHQVKVFHLDGVEVNFSAQDPMPLRQTILILDSRGNTARVSVDHQRRTMGGEWLCFATVYDGTLEPGSETVRNVRVPRRSTVEVEVRSDLLSGFRAE
jgi:hypothetical protein